MAINVTLGEVKTQTEKPFPKLMIRVDKDTFTIIFATEITHTGIRGICLETNDPTDTVGEYGCFWDEDVFKDYNEPITIQNA